MVAGAYGLRIAGADESALRSVPPDWPELSVAFEPRDGKLPDHVRAESIVFADEDRAEVWLGEGDWLGLRRDPLTLTARTARPLAPAAVIHPGLGVPSAIAGHWLGRRGLHGGAFRCGGKTWALLGQSGAGKSSTLGRLLLDGHTIVSDDILVLDGRTIFAGPATVDLREESGRMMGGTQIERLKGQERWRLEAGDAPAASELAGFVLLDWGPELAVERPGFGDVLKLLVESSVVLPDKEASSAYLELATLPSIRLERPRDLDRLGVATELLAATLSDTMD